jgi:hypothetical protein
MGKGDKILSFVKKHIRLWTWKPEVKAPPVVGLQASFVWKDKEKTKDENEKPTNQTILP